MRTTISMTMPQRTKQKLDKVAKQQDLNRSQIVQVAVNDYIAKFEFQQLRSQMVMKARQQGVFTDDDVFAQVS